MLQTQVGPGSLRIGGSGGRVDVSAAAYRKSGVSRSFSRDWISESSRQERRVCQELEIQSCDIPHLAQNERDVGHPRSVASTKGSVVVCRGRGLKLNFM
jgi:hypothetical protein